jgi:hypothetical protein
MMQYGSMKTDGLSMGATEWYSEVYTWYNYWNDNMDCYPAFDTAQMNGPVTVDPKVEILRNNTVIAASGTTPVTQNVVAGEQISLTTRITGGPATASQWTIDGAKAIKDYVITVQNGEAKKAEKFALGSNDLNGSGLTFYWIVGGDPLDVQYSATINNVPQNVTAKFSVKKPTSTLTTTAQPMTAIQINTVQVGPMPTETIFALHYGEAFATPGISFTAHVTLPSGVTGHTSWAQLVTSTRTRKPVSGKLQTLSGSGLDGTFPDLEDIGDNSDSPLEGLGVPCDYTSVSANDVFDSWILFKPTVSNVNTIYVPLKKVHWSWSGSATRGIGCSSWTIAARAQSADANGADTTVYPEWTTNIEDSEWPE